MKKQTTMLVALVLWCFGTVLAQATFPYNGVKDQRDGWYAFTNATVIPQAGSEIKNATLVIKEGRVVSITPNGGVPEGAVVVDAAGKYIYPSFIDV